MGYNLFKFGAVWVAGKLQYFPQNPIPMSVPWYDEISVVAIGPATETPISWIKPIGMNILIADRVLLANISWEDLAKNSFIKGKQTTIRGQRFRCRLLQVGAEPDAPNEWDQALSIAGVDNSIWHWNKMLFWGIETILKQKSAHVVRGKSPDYWTCFGPTRTVDLGFRLVLEFLGAEDETPNCTLDGVDFHLSSIPGGESFCPILQPVQKDIFADIPDNQQIKMYTLLKDGHPVYTDAFLPDTPSDTGQLEITDRYFGDEYLIPWTISNGVAVANQSLVQQPQTGVK